MQSIAKSPTAAPSAHVSRNLFEDLFKVSGLVRRRWRLIAVINLIFVTLAVLYLARTKTLYKSTARLLVIQQGERPINVGGPSPFGHLPSQSDTLSTHLLLIRSPIIVGRALDLAQLNHLSVDAVINNLKVQQPAGGGKVVDLEYQTDSRDDANRVMEACIASYDQFLKENFQKDTRDVIALIGKARDELSKELKELEHKYLEFRKEHPGLTGSIEGRSFLARRLDQWDQAAGSALARALQLRTQVELARKLSKEGVASSVINAALNQLAGASGPDMGAAAAPTLDSVASQQADLFLDDGSYEQIADQLATVEYQRRGTEKMLEHLRSQQAAMAREKPVDEREMIDAFYADPDVARRVSDLDDAHTRHDHTKRVARSTSDPAVALHKDAIKKIEDEIGRLWQERKTSLQGQLRDHKEDDTIRQSEINLMVLRAREAFLRERAEETRSEQLANLRGQRARLRRESGDQDPRVLNLDRQIRDLETDSSTDLALRKGRGQTDVLIQSLERSLEGVETMRAEIQKRLETDVATSHDTEITLLVESNLRTNLDRQRTLFDSVAAQLKQAQIVSDYGSVTAQTISPPNVKPSRPWISAVLGLALVLGSSLGVLGGFMVELFEARIRTVSELRAIVKLPVISVIPDISPQQIPGLSDRGLLCQEAPRTLAAELYKSARTQLEIIRRDRCGQVLMLSSPHGGDGKTTTASNLAISQAIAGRRTLLIDGDLRRPSIHSIYNLDRDRGLSQLLTQTLSCTEAVQATSITNLDVITCGPVVSNPAELLAFPQLGQLIEELRPAYDVIIFDSPPFLAVTDPLIISAVVDGIILVVRIGDVRRQSLEQSMEVLNTLKTPALGVLINGVTRDQLGFDHRFSVVYGYGYGYGYGCRPTTPQETSSLSTRQSGKLEMMFRKSGDGKRSHSSSGLDGETTV